MDYNYYEEMYNDVKNWIDEHINLSDYEDRDDLEQYLNDELFTADEITGNASGSYFFNSYKAEEAICHNWDLLAEAVDGFCASSDILSDGPESCDVVIRCYLLNQVISSVLDDIWSE